MAPQGQIQWLTISVKLFDRRAWSVLDHSGKLSVGDLKYLKERAI
jgi:hypothetical protein